MDYGLVVLVLNWNNWKDTIECLKSLKKQTYSNFKIIIIDNGSTDDSIMRINDWIINNYSNDESNYVEYKRSYKEDVFFDKNIEFKSNKKVAFIKISENFGFAKGNNVGIKYSLLYDQLNHIFLLNNDTVLNENSISNLINEVNENPEIKVATPKICYFDTPNKIWNCGGEINWFGRREYYFAQNNVLQCPKENFRVGLITGCALLINKEIIQKYGMLTERFFFGEEDWDFSLRMKDNGVDMFCIPSVIIYHKVSSSTVAFFDKGKVFKVVVNYINRFINFKSRYRKYYWFIWREVYFIYIIYLLKRNSVSMVRIFKAIYLIRKYSNKHNNVSREIVENIRKDVNYIDR